MRKILILALYVFSQNIVSGQFSDYYEIIEENPKVVTSLLDGKVKVTHLYKSQIRILHENQDLAKDSLIEKYVDEIFIPHKQVWGAFFNEKRFREWLDENWETLNNPNHAGIKLPFETDFDSVFIETSNKLLNMTGREPNGDWYLFYGTGGDMGGLWNGIMFANLIVIGEDGEDFIFSLPHEINHQIFKETNIENKTLLRRTIDEGLACYVNYLYWNKQYSPANNIDFEEDEWIWAMTNESMIYDQFLRDMNSTDDSTISKYTRWHVYLWDKSPDRLAYFIGFRIVESYVKTNGSESWKELFEIPVQDIFRKSNYKDYIHLGE